MTSRGGGGGFGGQPNIQQLMKQVDPQQLTAGSGVDVGTLTGKTFFPQLISDAFKHGLVIAFVVSTIMLLIAAGASLMRGKRYVHVDEPETVGEAVVRESAALDGVPGADVAYEDAITRLDTSARSPSSSPTSA